MMFDEEFMEDCIVECPRAFLGCELKIVERQAQLGGFRPDLICNYKNETWIIEIQQRAPDRIHLYKCLEYRDFLKRDRVGEAVRVKVVCNSVDEKYMPLAETHQVEIITIDRENFVELAAQSCPKSISKFIKRNDSSDFFIKRRFKTKYHFHPLGWRDHLSLTEILGHIYSESGRLNFKLGGLRGEIYWNVLSTVESLISRE